MHTRRVTITNQTGLHARPAAAIVSLAGQFSSEITLSKLDAAGEVVTSAPAKSVIFVLSMALTRGTMVEISAEGDDERTAVDALAGLIASGFEEG
ncbi:MAG: HPr family phosphocarrier protein [Oscillospiraceae bacterium]|nr:HPr family phosphocarrier protein [Oscillospiraceae bacterium]